MQLKKYMAFTLAELMIIMAVLTVLLAATAPVFTARYKNSAIDFVWQTSENDNTRSIYAAPPNQSMTQTMLIGVSPSDGSSVLTDYAPLSKLIIRSSDHIGESGNKLQSQIELRYHNMGKAYLFAGNGNLLLGGQYANLRNTANNNTAFGVRSLDAIVSGDNNTAIGYDSLNTITSGSNNTAIGFAGKELAENSSNNTIISNSNSMSHTAHSHTNNVFIGYYSDLNSTVNNSVIIGSGIQAVRDNGNFNTLIGSDINVSNGSGNLVIGNNKTISNGSYNTIVGYSASSASINNANRVTIIGATNTSKINYLNPDSDSDRVYIGGEVKGTYPSVLEVYNTNPSETNSNSKPIGDMPDSTVIVNGDLIVRGQSYFSGLSGYKFDSAHPDRKYPALMGFHLLVPDFSESDSYLNTDHTDMKRFHVLAGDDGAFPNRRISRTVPDNGNIITLQEMTQRGSEHCICTYSSNGNGRVGDDKRGIASYDWTSYYSSIDTSERNKTSYFDLEDGAKHNNTYFVADAAIANNYSKIELNKAHSILVNTNSCCPILNSTRRTHSGWNDFFSSDLRLKNIIDNYEFGLNKLSKLKIYNYTYKSNQNKQFVGVVAQDLKKIFPTSVYKNQNGYYEIRWDEMFYASINAVKELNAKITDFATKISNDINRINKLKKNNKELLEKIDKLSAELDELENK